MIGRSQGEMTLWGWGKNEIPGTNDSFVLNKGDGSLIFAATLKSLIS
jgi:hypothetical protein